MQSAKLDWIQFLINVVTMTGQGINQENPLRRLPVPDHEWQLIRRLAGHHCGRGW